MTDALRTGGIEPLRNAGGKLPYEVREMFSRVAQRYDFLNHLLSLGLDIGWRKAAARELLALRSGDVVADLCTGTGDLALAIVRAVPHARVLALDFTPEMVAYGPRKAARTTLSGVVFGIGDTLRLPLKNDACAAATVAFGIRNVGDTEAGLSEMVRVVRPGGKVLVLEFTKPSGSVFGPMYMFYLKNVLPLVATCMAWVAGDAYRYLPKSIQAFAGPQEMSERLRAVGLQDIRALPLTFGTVHLYVGVK